MEFPEDRKAPLYGSFYRFEKPKIVSRIIASKMRWDNHEFYAVWRQLFWND